MDNSARIGLINSFLARAAYYANTEKNYDKAANDFRSAIFYMKIYPVKEQTIANSTAMIASAHQNLNQCLRVTGFDRASSSRYKKAEELRAMGNFSASAYEFYKASEDESISANANAQIADLLKLLGNEQRSADYYKIALDKNPNDGILRMKYARTLDKLGRYDEAVVQYNTALANSKGDMEVRSTDMGHYFRISPDARGLNYDKFYVEGTVTTESDEAYTSHNTNILDVDGVVAKIMTTDYVKEELEGRPHAVEA